MKRQGESRQRAKRAAKRLDLALTQELKKLGPYVLLGKLGSGPTGRVYLSNHIQ